MSGISLKKQLLGSSAFVLTALFLLIIIAWNSAESSEKQFARVTHTYQAINSLHIIQADLNFAEIEQRGYLLTGKEFKLKNRNEALARVDSDIANSAALSSDPSFIEKISLLRQNIRAYEQALNDVINSYRTQGLKGLSTFTEKAYAVKQSTHKLLAEMSAYEVQHLNQRNQLEARSIWQQHASFIALLIFIISVIMILFWRMFLDIDGRERYEAKLVHQAGHDDLTGLANRNLFNDRLDQAIVYAKRAKRIVMVILIDVDRFKLVNDSLGHGVGDALLKEISSRLTACARPGDTVARLGGDEFALVMSDMAAESDAISIAQKFVKHLSGSTIIDGHSLAVSASIGIALYPKDADSAEILLKYSDMAMYRAKEAGRNGFQFYMPDMNLRLTKQVELEAALRGALERNEMLLYYQPKVELQQGSITGAEALIRWQHPQLGMISPAEFIPLAEESGLILPIGTWVIETVCHQMKIWQSEGIPVVPLAVNLSARQFQHQKLSELVSEILDLSGIDARCLEFEITESVMMQDPQRAAETMNELKKIGVSISLDDFGTGYSSLNYLKKFPIDTVKIDRSFINNVTADLQDAAIVMTIISLAKNLNIDVIAEGVESEEQLHFLRRHACDAMQGYLFSPPVPSEKFSAMLEEEKRQFMGISGDDELATG